MAETTTMDNVNTTAVVEQRNGILSNVRDSHLTQVLKNLFQLLPLHLSY